MNQYWVDKIHDDVIIGAYRIKSMKGKMGFIDTEVLEVLYKNRDKESGYFVEPGFTTTLLDEQVLDGESELFRVIFGDPLP